MTSRELTAAVGLATNLTVEVEADAHLHFALQRLGVPAVKRVAVRNEGPTEVTDVRVEVTLGTGAVGAFERRIGVLPSGTTHNLPNVQLELDGPALRQQRERVSTALAVRVRAGAGEGPLLASSESIVEVLPLREWPGLRSLPELLAAFVLPDDPAVADVLARAAVHLQNDGRDGSFDGYASRDQRRVLAVAEAVHAAVRELAVQLEDLPADFARAGAAVRFPADVARARTATDLDLALFWAAVLERAALHPLVVLAGGAVLAGLWLTPDTFQEAAVEDGLRLRKRVDLEEILLVEAGSLARDASGTFAQAGRAARRRLDDLADFECALDVGRCRATGVLPLPIEAEAAAGAVPASIGAAGAAEPTAEGALPTASAAAAAEAPESPGNRLDRWKRKLLDLSLRNRLVNFRPTKLTLRLVYDDLPALEDALSAGADFVLRPAPAREARAERAPKAEDDERVARFHLEELGQRRLYTALGKDDLDARLVDLWRHARLAQEESGANVLFLALGMLRWYETRTSDQVRCAPLLLLPLELERISAREGFRVRLGEEEPRVNITLLEKLGVEFQLAVDGLDELTEDENGIDVRALLQRFRRAVRDVDRWDVADEAWIAPFSFAKFLMWRDLVEQREALLQAPVLRHLVERPNDAFEPDAEFPDAARLDETLPPQASFCPLDADSSQLAAVVAAAAGRSFVLAGPPGTGKSQTIANLIAQCLANGRRVLFVAEKMAALDVVRSRLARVGLAPFCLELHSKESSKRTVLDSLQQALDLTQAREPQEWQKLTAQLAEARAHLNAWVDAMHRPRPIGETVFQVTSALVGSRLAPRLDLPLPPVDLLDAAWIEQRREACDAVRAAAAEAVALQPRPQPNDGGRETGTLAAHPLRHVHRGRFEATLQERAAAAVRTVEEALAGLATASAGVRDVLGLDVAELPLAAFSACAELIECVLATPGAADALLTEPGFADLRPRLLAAVEDVRQKDLLRERVREGFADSVLGERLEDLLGRLRQSQASFWPLSWLRARPVRAALRAHAKGGHLEADAVLARRLEDAIDLRGRIAALDRADHVGARCFGALWRGGDPGPDGVVRLQEAVAWAARTRAAMRALADALGEETTSGLRRRVVELAGPDRDALDPAARVGAALRSFCAERQRFDAARAELGGLLELDGRAWVDASADAPWLAHCGTALRELATMLDALPVWCHWRRVRARAAELDLGPLVAALESDDLRPADVPAAFERAWRQAWLAATTDADPLLREFGGREHERLIQRFAEVDARLLEINRDLVRARLAARIPRGSTNPAASSELGILLRELAKKTRHKPLRRLFAETPNLLPLLKPCFLMSPLSVAQYLAPGHALFDVVVFDEASQIMVADAVGALARGRACVVVGDRKQLPPTTFFQRLEEGDEDPDDVELEELESILDECSSAGLRTLRLRWHYRSRHESLIAFSNWHYYDNALFTFPAAEERSPRLGVSLVHVPDGIYERSRSRTNLAEAKSVVHDLVARLRAVEDPAAGPSFGVVTFSQAQQALVETLLDEERRADASLERFFGDGVPEPVFVKNLENVQGDERDVVLFSICYGPDAAGKVAMSFGPLNTTGGERRLNVAVTRARRQVIVHATLRPDQIDLARTNALGVKHLKAFLDYAGRGPSALGEALALEPTAIASAFEQDVRAALQARGHVVDARVGCSGYRVDLAVRDPSDPTRFLLGIECDGAFYRSATTARDRDRLRRSVLEHLGWRLARVWSSDWWRSRERELARLEQRLAEAAQEARAPDSTQRPSAPTEAAAADPAGDERAAEQPVEAALGAADENADRVTLSGGMPLDALPYAPARSEGEARGPFEAAPAEAIADVIAAVLATEAPVHGELLVRRVASFFDLPRVTARTRARVLELARSLPPDKRPSERDEVLWPPGLDPDAWSAFRVPAAADPASQREAEHIPPEEVANAAVHVVRTQVALGRQDLLRQTALLLGFARVGARVRASIAAGIDRAVARGRLRELDGKVTLAR